MDPRKFFTPHFYLRTQQPMTRAQVEEVKAAFVNLTEPLEDGQVVELAGVSFVAVNL